MRFTIYHFAVLALTMVSGVGVVSKEFFWFPCHICGAVGVCLGVARFPPGPKFSDFRSLLWSLSI